MKNTAKKLPGKGMRILSFIPAFNWIALLYIGIVNSNTMNIICGIIYGAATFAVPSTSLLFWIAGIAHYSIAYNGVKRQMGDLPQHHPPQLENQPKYNNTPSKQGFSDVTLSGEAERRQAISARPAPKVDIFQISFSGDSAQSKFFLDMQKYIGEEGAPAAFEPFMTYWPTYDSMNRQQQAWYFYWRSQVRSGNYPDTDLSYVFVHIYELLSGIGWQTPQDGYQQLLALWSAYQERFPKLSYYLYDWTFDFAQLHDVEHTASLSGHYLQPGSSPMTDILVAQHADEIPLKLPFALIDALCDYSLVSSKFYKNGHQALMQEAIPRVVALADAALRKKKQKGILATYGPNRPKKQEYYAFRSAVCPDANKKISVSVKAYSSNTRLRGYINELVRYGENTLRALYDCRGRLRGVQLDEETANLVEIFLKKEYSKSAVAASMPAKKTEVTLDFESIHILREQSDAVRTALQVEETVTSVQKELLTDLQEVTSIYAALSSEARQLLDRLHASGWVCEQTAAEEPLIAEINRLAEYYLSCALLAKENDTVMAEDDYRDELEYIYKNRPQLSVADSDTGKFNMSVLSPELKEFVENLVPEQKKALYVVLTQEHPQNELEQIAEEAMTMSQMLLDEINETALRVLGDIVVDAMDTEPRVLDEYVTLLKESVA
ncbi:TerB N-terminal domain-containing protein [Desulforamulus aeronauticus]|uniref:TerB-C domain-containing protein n=1 Tax=Desulforamulus aeronauticus DSM 10349 TaxID=1121421 RepID=A0A1M6SST0_9FIRM|nr:TerB N-terminal domain-containing protein [Desulforamulus aeronauticus]SHK47638.1 TerB-C domain-containing protein [Desulforamulus aeronauticus DSM 10349]